MAGRGVASLATAHTHCELRAACVWRPSAQQGASERGPRYYGVISARAGEPDHSWLASLRASADDVVGGIRSGRRRRAMGRAPCCDKVGLKRGRWTAEEDQILSNYIAEHGEGSWKSLPNNAGNQLQATQ
jgi:hypothetical protein